jgi:hypothetical protein
MTPYGFWEPTPDSCQHQARRAKPQVSPTGIWLGPLHKTPGRHPGHMNSHMSPLSQKTHLPFPSILGGAVWKEGAPPPPCGRVCTGRPGACCFFFCFGSFSFWNSRLISCIFNSGAHLAFNTHVQVDKAQGEGNKPSMGGKPLPISPLPLAHISQHQLSIHQGWLWWEGTAGDKVILAGSHSARAWSLAERRFIIKDKMVNVAQKTKQPLFPLSFLRWGHPHSASAF